MCSPSDLLNGHAEHISQVSWKQQLVWRVAGEYHSSKSHCIVSATLYLEFYMLPFFGTVVIQEICFIYCISETSHTIPYLEICLVILPKEDYQCKSNIAVITLSTDDLQTRKHLIASLLSKK